MFELFAQRQFQNGNSGPPPEVVGGILFVLGFACVMVTIGLVIQYFFLTNLKNVLLKCSPRNRKMEPSQVYLAFIPIFNLYWNFKIVGDIEESLKDEFYDRRLEEKSSYGKDKGQPWALCTVLSAIPYIGVIIAFVSLVFFIMYWLKMNEIRRELETSESSSDFNSDDEPRRKKKKERYDDSNPRDDEY